MEQIIGYTTRRLGLLGRAPRLFLDGTQPERARFTPGVRFRIEQDWDNKKIILALDDQGDKIVHRKIKYGREVPAVDLKSLRVLGMFAGCEAVAVYLMEGRIEIAMLHVDRQVQERIERLKDNLAKDGLETGSISCGAGALSHAVHQGLKQSGLTPNLRLALDIDQRMLDQAGLCNDAWDKETINLCGPMQHLAFDPAVPFPHVDLLEMGIPCSGASILGVVARKLDMMEEHPEVGFLVAAAINIIARTNPALVLIENVPKYRESASAAILRGQLRAMGYDIKESEFVGTDFGALEERRRYVMLAVTKGLDVELADLPRPAHARHVIGDILQDVPLDSPLWNTFDGMKERARKMKAKGHNFQVRTVDAQTPSVKTLTKGYAQGRAIEPKLAHPADPSRMRRFTPVEHARIKGIPEHLVEGIPWTQAHESLGQSVIHPVFAAIARHIGYRLRSWLDASRVTCSAAAAPFGQMPLPLFQQ